MRWRAWSPSPPGTPAAASLRPRRRGPFRFFKVVDVVEQPLPIPLQDRDPHLWWSSAPLKREQPVAALVLLWPMQVGWLALPLELLAHLHSISEALVPFSSTTMNEIRGRRQNSCRFAPADRPTGKEPILTQPQARARLHLTSSIAELRRALGAHRGRTCRW